MADRRFSFMDPLVLAIAAGEKDVTRRLIALREFGPSTTFACSWHFYDRRGLWNDVSTELLIAKFSAYRPGDTLAVCEALVPINYDGDRMDPDLVGYRCDNSLARDGHARAVWGWKVRALPARYCPSWAVRYRRRILSVRPERLTSVTDDEVRREGVTRLGWEPTAAAFVDGFRKMHKLDADADPWVWRVEFEREDAR